MTPWAPLIYGRTKFVDFRFLALPEQFSRDDRSWAEGYVLGSLRRPEALPANPRWVRFANAEYLVIGVGCMASEIAGADKQDYTRDVQGRPLYLFLGWVAQLKDAPATLPAYGDLAPFRELYDLVRERWEDQNYDRDSVIVRGFDKNLVLDEAPASGQLALNSAPERLQIWPASNGPALWSLNPGAPTSLCLSLSSSQDGLASPFLNITVCGAEESAVVARPVAAEALPPPRGPERSAPTPTLDWPQLLQPTRARLIGGTVGAGIGFFVSGGPNPLGMTFGVVGFGIGWTATGAAESYVAQQAQRSQAQNTTPGYGLRERPAETPPAGNGAANDTDTDWFTP